MGANLHLLILLLSVVVFIVATWQSSAPSWNRLVALGLALFAASFVPF